MSLDAADEAGKRATCAGPSVFELLRLYAVDAVAAGQTVVLAGLQRLLFRRLDKTSTGPPIQRILVKRVANLGDALVAVPAMRALRERFPAAYIVLLTSPGIRGLPGADDVLSYSRLYDEVVVYFKDETASIKGQIRIARELRAQTFDLYIVLPPARAPFRGQLRELLLAAYLRCPYAVGFQVARVKMFARTQSLWRRVPSEVDRLFALLKPLDVEGCPASASIRIPDESRAAVSRLLAEHGVADDELLIAINPGAKYETQRWPLERFIAVAKALDRRWRGRLVVTGSPGEVALAGTVGGEIPHALITAGKVSVLEAAALLERCSVLVSNDTGTMHLANAVGTPTVAIFSARNPPHRWYPYGPQHIVLHHDVPCGPCERASCPNGLLCLNQIEVSDVVTAVGRILSASHPARSRG